MERTLKQTAGDRWPVTIAMVTFGLVSVIAIYWMPSSAAVSVWTNSTTYNASYLVMPITIYFVWLRRQDVARLTPRPHAPGFFYILCFGLFGLVSQAADVQLGQQLAVVGTIQAMLLTMLGWRIFKALLFPVLFLWLLVPTWDFLLPALMRMVAALTVAGVAVTGLDAGAEGYLITVARKQYSIIAECAALDFLIGALMISLVFGALMYQSFHKRLILIVIALFTALAANLFRTISVILITHHSGGGIDLVSSHQTYGWCVFFVATLLLMWGGYRFRDKAEHDNEAAPEHESHGPAASPARLFLVLAAAISATGLAPAYGVWFLSPDGISGEAVVCLPLKTGPWRKTAASDWRPVVPGEEVARFHHGYAHEGRNVDLYVAYFTRQRQGSELVGWRNRMADGETWYLRSRDRVDIRVNGAPVRAITTGLGNGERRRLVWHWYWVDGEFTGSRPWAKLLQARAELFNGERRAALVAVSAEQAGGSERASAAMAAFLNAAPQLDRLLTRAGPSVGRCPRQ